MRSKTDIKKPNVYIAIDLDNTVTPSNTALDLAEAVEHSPFIDKIFAVEALYDVHSLSHLPDGTLTMLQDIVSTELELADILIADLRDGDPVELGYAIAKDIPVILYNPDRRGVSPLVYSKPVLEVYDLDTLADTNFLKILLQQG